MSDFNAIYLHTTNTTILKENLFYGKEDKNTVFFEDPKTGCMVGLRIKNAFVYDIDDIEHKKPLGNFVKLFDFSKKKD